MLDGGDDADLVDMAEDGIERNLQIIGEAANHLPAEVTDAQPRNRLAIDPAASGTILVRQYFGVDAAVVRDVIEIHLSPLGEAFRRPGAPQVRPDPPSDHV